MLVRKTGERQNVLCSLHALKQAVRDFLLPAPEEGQVHNGCEGIDKLQDEGFEDETLFETLVCLWNL